MTTQRSTTRETAIARARAAIMDVDGDAITAIVNRCKESPYTCAPVGSIGIDSKAVAHAYAYDNTAEWMGEITPNAVYEHKIARELDSLEEAVADIIACAMIDYIADGVGCN